MAKFLDSSSILKNKSSNHKIFTNSKHSKRSNTNSKNYCKSIDKKYKFEQSKSEEESKKIEEKDKRNLTISYKFLIQIKI